MHRHKYTFHSPDRVDPAHSMSVVADHHRRCKQIREEICAMGYDPRKFFVLLLNTSQLEFVLKEVWLRVHCVFTIVLCLRTVQQLLWALT